MKARDFLTSRIPATKLVAKEMEDAAFHAIFLVSIILPGTFTPALSQTSTVIVRSTGTIATANVIASSGSARDIQSAVDQVIAYSDIGNVHIPAGTFDFVEVGEPWMTVNVPAGINVFGAPTERTSGYPEPENGLSPNDQVVEWKTVLVMPYTRPEWEDRSTWINWFTFTGSGDSRRSRFSDIKLIGYRSFDPDAMAINEGVYFNNVVDFRVDHCYFEHIVNMPVAPSFGSRGVIDHSYFVNNYGHVEATLSECTVGYGLGIGRGYGDLWEDDVSLVLGHYTPYTLFIEDCYLQGWRHATSSNSGGHYIIRHSTIKNDFGFGSIDAHGWGRTDDKGNITQVGTRAVEIYNCQITDAAEPPGGIYTPQTYVWATMIRGGAGVAFNNIVGGGTYAYFINLSNEAQETVPKCYSHDWWIWNNTMLARCEEIHVNETPEKYYPHEDIDYFRRAPHTFDYEPYPYPHPLTL